MLYTLSADTTTGRVGALIGAEARSSEVASSFPGFSVPAGGKLMEKWRRKKTKLTLIVLQLLVPIIWSVNREPGE